MGRRAFLACVGAGVVGVVAIAEGWDALMTDVTPLGQRIAYGAYAANEPWPDLSAHYALEESLGMRFSPMSWFLSLEGGWPARQAVDAADSQHDLLLCWQPSQRSGRAIPFVDILKGAWDRRMDSFFRQAAAYPHKITIRFAHEMNLAQMPQSIANKWPCTDDLDVWLDTWRYVVDRQRAIGGDNVTWQWCVSSIDMGGVAAESYWPGADYVDNIGIDIYNGYGPWTPATKLIRPMYNRLISLHPSCDIWLSEIGCRPVASGERLNKSTWFSELFDSTEFPRLTHVVFFNSNKERDWRIDTDDIREPLTQQIKSAVRQVAR